MILKRLKVEGLELRVMKAEVFLSAFFFLFG